MAAQIWSDVEPNATVEIVLWSGVKSRARIARIRGHGIKQVVAFEFDQPLPESQLMSYLQPEAGRPFLPV
jgi:hypothetical protein